MQEASMTAKTLEAVEADIANLVDEAYRDRPDNSDPIYDGIVDYDCYLQACYKVMWILKEPYDEDIGTGAGGGWCLKPNMFTYEEAYKKPRPPNKRRIKTYDGMVYVTYSILNGFQPFDYMEDIDKDPTMARVLRCVAMANVKKLPGRSTTRDPGVIMESYRQHKSLIMKQIDGYAPDLVIASPPHGPTLLRDVGLPESAIQRLGATQYGRTNTRAFISTYHPAKRGSRDEYEEYIDEVVEAAKRLLVGTGI